MFNNRYHISQVIDCSQEERKQLRGMGCVLPSEDDIKKMQDAHSYNDQETSAQSQLERSAGAQRRKR